MSKILVIAQYTQLPGEKGNNRARFKLICEMLSQEGFDVTVVTSKFRDLDRAFRTDYDQYERAPYKIIMLDEVGYYKNISFRRLYSMWSFARNLKRYLRETKQNYELIYASVPGLDSAYIAGLYSRERGIPFVIDVQDIWPESMYDLVLDVPLLSDILFSPLRVLADRVYSMADGIMAVSKTYRDIAIKRAAMRSANEPVHDYVFIGTNLDEFVFRKIQDSEILHKPSDEFWITYIGSLGHSYDIKTFLEGSKLANEKGLRIIPIILGSGPMENELKQFAKEIGSNARFIGWVDHTKLIVYLRNSDAVINAIKKRAPQSITNKIGDYLASGRPLLNGSLNMEFIDLLEKYKFGVSYEPENATSLSLAIEKLFSMSEIERNQMGSRARALAEAEFDRNKTYRRIIKMINDLKQ